MFYYYNLPGLVVFRFPTTHNGSGKTVFIIQTVLEESGKSTDRWRLLNTASPSLSARLLNKTISFVDYRETSEIPNLN